jgi:hypothetical protein
VAVLEHEQVAPGRIPAEGGGHHPGQAVDPLAAVDRFDGQVDGPGRPQGQHGPPRKAATSRPTWDGSDDTGTRTVTPPGRDTSAEASATTRTGASVRGGPSGGDAAGRETGLSPRLFRQVWDFRSVSPRARQNARTERPDAA